METAEIAKIAVAAAPYSIDKPYDYLVPEALAQTALPGSRVNVPFGKGNRTSEGIVLQRLHGAKMPGLKAISAVLDPEPVLDASGLSLALWMRRRYFCTFFEAAKTILPSGLWYRFRTVYRLTEEAGKAADMPARPEEQTVLQALQALGGSAEEAAIQKACGGIPVTELLKALCRRGMLEEDCSARRRVHDKTRRMAELAMEAEDALALVQAKRGTSPVRKEIVLLLASEGQASAADLCYYTGASMRMLQSLERAGVIRLTEEEVLRVPELPSDCSGEPIRLNEEQEVAFSDILSLIDAGRPGAALLEGVTGSGKTQVYIRLCQEVLQRGRSAMVLVPEIVLTPQMMARFSAYFGDRAAMLHSGLRMSERYDQWKRIRRGEVQLVLGTRSAVFAPLQKIGLMILDEEQESSYCSENPPRYHAREIAQFRCGQEGAALVLGSATPSVESAYRARQGDYRHELLRRRYNDRGLPEVLIVDQRREIRRGNAGIISEVLQAELEKNLAAGEQSILLLNRRGNSRMLLCGECGRAPECPRCSTALTYHSANGRLMCHYCGHSERAAARCPYCGGIMKPVGIGTQKAEEELHRLFPETQVLRMDADTAADGHERLLREFEEKKIPILLGTQMVAKGLDFPDVTLVGVLSADTSLYVDHYRAAERTFSLLTQVVGRAGRGDRSGRAVIQTYTPDNAVIQAAARQDYESFYESEIRLRRLRRCPPFADLFTFTVSGTDEAAVLRGAVAVREHLRRVFPPGDPEEGDPEILGPAPAPVLKVNNRYRYRVTLTGRNSRKTREKIGALLRAFPQRKEFRKLNIFVDCNAPE